MPCGPRSMNRSMLDRDGIQRLLLLHTRAKLSHEFGISLPTLRKFLRGAEPHHLSLTEFINRRVKELSRK